MRPLPRSANHVSGQPDPPHANPPMIEWIESHGTWFYVITFFWTFLEGETFVIFAGFAAHLGILRLDYLIACAWIGSFCGDNLYFFLGRRYGERLVTRFPKMRAGTDLALAWLRRYDTWFILSFRFIYVVRNFSSFACGMSGIYWPRFMLLNFVAAGVWACTFAGAGYVFGAAFQHLIKDVALAFKLGILCLFMLVIGLSVFMHRKAKKQAARLQAQSGSPPPGA